MFLCKKEEDKVEGDLQSRRPVITYGGELTFMKQQEIGILLDS